MCACMYLIDNCQTLLDDGAGVKLSQVQTLCWTIPGDITGTLTVDAPAGSPASLIRGLCFQLQSSGWTECGPRVRSGKTVDVSISDFTHTSASHTFSTKFIEYCVSYFVLQVGV